MNLLLRFLLFSFNFFFQYKIAVNIFLYEEIYVLFTSQKTGNYFMIITSKNSVCIRFLNLSTFVVKSMLLTAFQK